MTRIDFYILEDSGPEARRRFACRLVEKVYQQGHRLYLYAADPQEATALDELLWSFRDGSFVPHEPLHADAAPAAEAPVLVGTLEPPAALDDVLVNLDGEVPGFFSRFHRVAEIIGGDEATRARGRERYRFYRERGYPLETHHIAA